MFKKISLSVLLLNMVVMNHAVSGGEQGWGRINMVGSIIDTACAIDTNSIDQTINMGNIPVSQIAKVGQGTKKNFAIKLINCILDRDDQHLPKWQYFTITFDGSNDNGLFSVEGNAKGIALKITDSSGKIAQPGSPINLGDIRPGDMSINFDIQLVANNKILRAGNYNSIIKFKMDYY